MANLFANSKFENFQKFPLSYGIICSLVVLSPYLHNKVSKSLYVFPVSPRKPLLSDGKKNNNNNKQY